MGKRNVLVRSTAYAKKVGKKLQEKREIIMLRCALPIGAKREEKKKNLGPCRSPAYLPECDRGRLVCCTVAVQRRKFSYAYCIVLLLSDILDCNLSYCLGLYGNFY